MKTILFCTNFESDSLMEELEKICAACAWQDLVLMSCCRVDDLRLMKGVPEAKFHDSQKHCA